MTERWDRVKELLQRALEHRDEERESFIEEMCGQDTTLRIELESLLASHEELDGEPPHEHPLHGLDLEGVEASSRIGEHVGPYRILRQLGRGGAGAVYLAVRDDDEYRHRVALKIVRRGMATADILQRFRSERQILASVDHPNIARLLDGGSTADGLPYFVMEYVEGEPIDRYCDRHKLGIEARVDLFQQVCSAVQAAHQNLVVHRDLKPGNILVTGEGTPKLLDFGIAKLLETEAGDEGADPTMQGMRFLTPDFASPEQVLGRAITTSSDVYSLGVLLYLLLTGHRPYRLADLTIGEMEQVIPQAEPARPSTVVGEVEEVRLVDGSIRELGPESIALARGTSHDRLCRQLSGDLDNVVLKALRKEPTRRYSSVERFAEDLRRHREGLPVSARPDTFRYRAGKFLRRHRLPATAAATAALVALGFTVALGVQARRLADARDLAQSEAAKVRAVNEFLQEILGAADPVEGMGASVTVIEAIEGAVDRIDPAFSEQPDVAAAVHLTVGKTLMRLGRLADAEREIRESLRVRRQLYGDEHLEIAESLNSLGEVQYDNGVWDDAERLYGEALQMRRRLLGPNHPDVATSLDNLANVFHERGDLETAERMYREALATRRRTLGSESREAANSLNNVAVVLHDRGDLEGAEALYRESLAMTRGALGDEHPDVAISLNNLAALMYDRDDLEAAEPLYRESVAMMRRLVGERHPSLAIHISNLALLVQAQGDLDEAERLFREALTILERGPGPHHPMAAGALVNLAELEQERDDWSAAESYWAEALALRRGLLAPDDPELLFTAFDRAAAEGRARGWRAVEPELRGRFEQLQAVEEIDNDRVAGAARTMAEMYEALGMPARARQYRET